MASSVAPRLTWNGGTRGAVSLVLVSLNECGLRHSHSTLRGSSLSEVTVSCGGRSAENRSTSPGMRSPPDSVMAGTRRGTRAEKLSLTVSAGSPARSTWTSSKSTQPSATPFSPGPTTR